MSVLAEVNRDLTPEETTLFSKLLRLVRQKDQRNRLRSEYVDMKRKLDKVGFSIPPSMVDFQTVLGWPHKAVEVPARRVRPNGFTVRSNTELLDDIKSVMDENYFASVERMAIRSSMQHSVAFVFTTPGSAAEFEPPVVIAARTAREASAFVNPRTNRVTSAIELVDRARILMYLPGRTLGISREKNQWRVRDEYVGIPGVVACVPYVWGKTLERPFGSSRVSRALMGLTDRGVRILLREESHAEFFSAPQRALLGADEAHFTDSKGNRISPLDALLGSIWALPDTRDEETGDLKRADLKQLTQASMEPHSVMMRTTGMLVSSETSMPVNYLGIIHDNPSSAEAITASEADMADMIRSELPTIGVAREQLARNVVATLHGGWTPAMESSLRGLKAEFKDPATVSDVAVGDALIKQAQVIPELMGSEYAMRKIGLDDETIRQLRAEATRARAATQTSALVARFEAASPATTPADQGAQEDGESALDEQLKQAQILKAKLDAFGVARRAGVNPESAAKLIGLDGMKIDPGVPITLKQPGE